MIRRLMSLLLALALFLPAASLAEEDGRSETDRSMDHWFSAFKAYCGEVVIAKDGEIIYRRSYGAAYGSPVDENSYYRLASTSKLVSATAVMRLVETGLLDLDENIGTYLHLEGEKPFFAASARYPKVGITARMLMTHTSGIWFGRNGGCPPILEALNPKTNKKYKESYYKEKPGTAHHYSNEGAGILGCIIEAITGKRLDEAVDELIFSRMGVDGGYSPEYLDVPGAITSDVVREYGDSIDLNEDYVFSYGNCWMRCSDLARIGMMLCDRGMYRGEQILKEETVLEMMSVQKGKGGITANVFGLNMDQSKVPYIAKNRIFYGHQGMSANCLCALFFEPESRFVFAMVSVCNDPANRQERIDGGLRALPYNLLKTSWKAFGAEP